MLVRTKAARPSQERHNTTTMTSKVADEDVYSNLSETQQDKLWAALRDLRNDMESQADVMMTQWVSVPRFLSFASKT